jgi:methionine-rich copper-binding protein CopC
MLRVAQMARLAFVIASLAGTAANAHPELKAADPSVGGAITIPPNEIRLSFTERIIQKFSGIELRDQSGRLIATSAAMADPKNKKQLVLPIQESLPPGIYNVDWHAVSVDTHRVEAHYTFKVGP